MFCRTLHATLEMPWCPQPAVHDGEADDALRRAGRKGETCYSTGCVANEIGGLHPQSVEHDSDIIGHVRGRRRGTADSNDRFDPFPDDRRG